MKKALLLMMALTLIGGAMVGCKPKDEAATTPEAPADQTPPVEE